MDSKIIAIIAVAVVVVAGAGVAFAVGGGNNDDGDDKYITLGRTNEFFPDHTCCVIIGNMDYIDSHADETARMLAGYIEAMDYLNNALKNPESQDYKDVVEVITNLLKSAKLTDQEVKDALANIKYLYADEGNVLTGLKASIADLVTQLDSVGALTKEAPVGFVNDFVNGAPLAAALTTSPGEYAEATVHIACISGDIHQIGVHLASQLGYFAKYGIKAEFEFANNGGGVVTALIQSGATANFGVVGAPPATLNAINQDLSQAQKYCIIARANSEGSGLYIKESVVQKDGEVLKRNDTAFFTVNGEGNYVVSEANKAAWGGLVFGTPGTTSIQHIQVALLAKQLGLNFKMYVEGENLNSDTIYYVTNIANCEQTLANTVINAGILWEPQYTRIISES